MTENIDRIVTQELLCLEQLVSVIREDQILEEFARTPKKLFHFILSQHKNLKTEYYQGKFFLTSEKYLFHFPDAIKPESKEYHIYIAHKDKFASNMYVRYGLHRKETHVTFSIVEEYETASVPIFPFSQTPK